MREKSFWHSKSFISLSKFHYKRLLKEEREITSFCLWNGFKRPQVFVSSEQTLKRMVTRQVVHDRSERDDLLRTIRKTPLSCVLLGHIIKNNWFNWPSIKEQKYDLFSLSLSLSLSMNPLSLTVIKAEKNLKKSLPSLGKHSCDSSDENCILGSLLP